MALSDEVLEKDKYKSGRLSDIPDAVRKELPFLEEPTPADMSIITKQLGRRPIGVVLIASRCIHSKPCVILSIPCGIKGKRIVPPLWLTCPAACRAAASLENSGEIKRMTGMLHGQAELRQAFLEEEKRFSSLYRKIYSLCFDEKTLSKLGDRGIAWSRIGRVKCLHAHLAYIIATGGFPGSLVGMGKCLSLARILSRVDSPNMTSGEGSAQKREFQKGIIASMCLPRIMETGGIACARPPDTCLN